jgi:hypothetical protein
MKLISIDKVSWNTSLLTSVRKLGRCLNSASLSRFFFHRCDRMCCPAKIDFCLMIHETLPVSSRRVSFNLSSGYFYRCTLFPIRSTALLPERPRDRLHFWAFMRRACASCRIIASSEFSSLNVEKITTFVVSRGEPRRNLTEQWTLEGFRTKETGYG